MRERESLRFIVAPPRYGKSCAAFGYAEAIFHLKQVFWIPGQDPRFLRDLDQDTIADSIFSCTTTPGLVVIDHLPYLHPQRSERLSRLCELLLTHGWELIITARPSCNNASSLKAPLTLLNTQDLLIDDEELSYASTQDPLSSAPAMHERIPVLAWGNHEQKQSFITEVLKEEVPSEILFAHLNMLLLQEGTLAHISQLQERETNSLYGILAELYPYLNISEESGSFKVEGIADGSLFEHLAAHAKRAIRAVKNLEIDTWAQRIGDILVALNYDERACAVISALCSASAREAWLIAHQDDFTHHASLYAPKELSASIARLKQQIKPELRSGNAWRLWQLGLHAQAFEQAQEALADVTASNATRLEACFVLRHDTTQSLDIDTLMRRFAQLPKEITPENYDRLLSKIERGCRESLIRWKAGHTHYRDFLDCCVRWLAFAYITTNTPNLRSLTRMEEQIALAFSTKEPVYEFLLCELLQHGLQLSAQLRRKGGLSKEGKRLVSSLKSLALDAVVHLSEHASASFFGLQLVNSASLSLSALLKAGTQPHYLEGLDEIKHKLEEQRAQTNLHPLKPELAFVRENIPQLQLNFLGGLTAYIGSKQIDPQLFRRQKVQTLAALLAIAQGREISIDFLESSLWPDSTATRSRNNFYNAWSLLKRALEISPKDCPYLVRLQNSCRIEPNLVRTDIEKFLDLCEQVQASLHDTSSLKGLFERLQAAYTGDLLPSEIDHPSILTYRTELQHRYIDACVTIGDRAMNANVFGLAIQAARTALRYDEGREDACHVLMHSQIALGRRSSAITTYFRCRRYLNNALGIDPSTKTAELYQRLLMDDDSSYEQLALPLSLPDN